MRTLQVRLFCVAYLWCGLAALLFAIGLVSVVVGLAAGKGDIVGNFPAACIAGMGSITVALCLQWLAERTD